MNKEDYKKSVRKSADEEAKTTENYSREEYYYALVDKLLEEVAELKLQNETLQYELDVQKGEIDPHFGDPQGGKTP